MEDNLAITKLSHLKKLIARLECDNPQVEDLDIPFEYICASCYPTVYQNVLDKLKQEHTAGYIEGIADSNNLTIDEIYDKIKEENEEVIVNIVSKMQEKVIND